MSTLPQAIPSFRSRRLYFAWLHASAQLEFLGAEFNPRLGKVEFVFADPGKIGRDLEDDFDNGPALIFSSFHYMRKQPTSAQNAARQNRNPNGDHRNVSFQSHRR